MSHEEVSQNSSRISTSNLISRKEKINKFYNIKQYGRRCCIKCSICFDRQDEKHPAMNGDDRDVVENDFSEHIFT